MEYVLITGATSGIGYEMAKIFAQNRYNLIIVASNAERLENVKEELEKEYQVDVNVFAEDLGKAGGGDRVYNRVKERKLEVSVLINNAGVGCVGAFSDIDYKQEEKMMFLNMLNVIALSKYFIKDMKLKNRGKILNVSSTGAFQPGPYISTYYATKAFVLHWSDALRMELVNENIEVSTLCPGATISNFSERAGKKQARNSMSAQKVAEIAYNGFMKNKRIIKPGFKNRIALLIPRFVRSYGIGKVQKKLMEENSLCFEK